MTQSYRPVFLLTTAVVLTGLLAAAPGARADGLPSGESLRGQLRDLFVIQDVYTRSLVISITSSLPDVEPTARALQNVQDQLAGALSPYYGDKTARLATLLHTYTTDVRSLIRAVRFGGGVQPARDQLEMDGGALADLLNGWNQTNWAHDEIAGHFRAHAVSVQREAGARMHGDWQGDLFNVTGDEGALLQLADLIARGVALQFPDRFAAGSAPPPPPVSVVVMTNDNLFAPQVLNVSPGTIIRWDNQSDLAHTVSTDTMNRVPGGPNSDADSPNGLAAGASYTWQVPYTAHPGDLWYYHDRFKGKGGAGVGIGPKMAGEIVVQ